MLDVQVLCAINFNQIKFIYANFLSASKHKCEFLSNPLCFEVVAREGLRRKCTNKMSMNLFTTLLAYVRVYLKMTYPYKKSDSHLTGNMAVTAEIILSARRTKLLSFS